MMDTKQIIFALCIGLILIITPVYSADYPHTVVGVPGSDQINCKDCHEFHGDPPWGTGGTDLDNTYWNKLCLSCHNGVIAADRKTHSSLQTDNRYGNWSAECKTCHDPHQHTQYSWGTSSYLYTSTVSNVLINTPVAGQSTIVDSNPTWTNGEFNASGDDFFVVAGDVNDITNNVYKVISNSGNNLVVLGIVNTTKTAAGDTFGILLGKLVRNSVKLDEIVTYTGTSTAVTSNSLTQSGAGWTTNEFAGLKLVPSAKQLNPLMYDITSNTSDTIYTATTFTATAGDPFQVVGGIRGATPVIKTGNKSVRFFRRTGSNSFADGDTTYDGICEVCHTQTNYHRNDASGDHTHNAGLQCTSCHPHTQGFKESCDNCHNSPPTTGKHATHFATGSVNYGTTTIQSTTTAYGFSCGICHTGTHLNTPSNPHTVEINFAGVATQDLSSGSPTYTPASPSIDDPGTGWTFNYSDGTCSNTYCHGNYPGSGKNASPSFEIGTAPCGSCHDATNTTPPASGTHDKHARTTGYYLKCTLCHKNIVSGSGPTYTIADKSKHLSGYVDWNFDSSDPRISGGTYSINSGTDVPSNGTTPRAYGNCSNVYCHSNVQPNGGIGGPDVYASPQWGTTVNCGECHAGGHGALITTGSHSAHLAYDFTTGSNNLKCVICHNWFPSRGSLACTNCHILSGDNQYEKHANYQIEIVFDSAFNNSAFYNQGFTPGNGYSNCSNTYCHSNGTSISTGIIPNNNSPNWGSGALACNSCHGFPPDYNNGNPKANSHSAHSEYLCNKCHVNTTSDGTTITSTVYHVNKTYNVDAGAGASFTYTYSPTGGSCSSISCHGGSDATWGSTLSCDSCHDYDVVGATYAGGVWTGGTWGKLPHRDDPVNEGWGAHAKHINHIKTVLNISTALNPVGQTFGSGEPANVCGTCHTNSGANHSMGGSTVRTINFGDGTYKYGGAGGFSFVFGATNPVYNGVSGTSSSVNPKTCSNVSCHFSTTPVWNAY